MIKKYLIISILAAVGKLNNLKGCTPKLSSVFLDFVASNNNDGVIGDT
jgi:hypothetical protein